MADGFVNFDAVRTYEEVARILTERGEPITKGGVFMAERSALQKLRLDPVLREIAAQLQRDGAEARQILSTVARALDCESIDA